MPDIPLIIIPDHGTFLAKHIKALKPGIYQVTITRARNQHTSPQERYFHGVVLPCLAQAMHDASGEPVGIYEAKELLRSRYLMRDIVNQETGEVKWQQPRSTRDLSKEEYSVLIEQAIKFCAEMFNVDVPPPTAYYSDVA